MQKDKNKIENYILVKENHVSNYSLIYLNLKMFCDICGEKFGIEWD